MNRAQKGWQTRYENEIAILEMKIKDLREELYNEFLQFIRKTAKYQSYEQELTRMHNELHKFHRKHNGGSSSEEEEKEKMKQ